MNIIGVLSWYDESPTWLSACVSGFARVCDTIIAVDGAYALYPGGRPRSLPDQAYAIQDACEAAGAGLVLHRPRQVFWGNEVEKRQLTFDLARPFADDETWLLVFDSDYLVMHCDPVIVRTDLAQTDCNAATYTLVDSKDLQEDAAMAESALTLDLKSEWAIRTRCIYRWTDDLEYGPAHWTIRGTYNGKREWVYGPDLTVWHQDQATPTIDLNTALIAVHRRQLRAKTRFDAAEAYQMMREQSGIEKGAEHEMASVVVA